MAGVCRPQVRILLCMYNNMSRHNIMRSLLCRPMYIASSDYVEPDGHQPVAQSLRDSLEDLLYVRDRVNMLLLPSFSLFNTHTHTHSTTR